MRFGLKKMLNSSADLGRPFTNEEDNPLCSRTWPAVEPFALYDVFRCEQVLPGRFFTLQTGEDLRLEVQEINFRVELKHSEF